MKRRVVLVGLPKGLEIYLADQESGWCGRGDRKFTEEFRGHYTLEVDGKEGQEFKCFVRTISLRRRALTKQLRGIRLQVTGKGQVVPSSWLFRVLFPLLPIRIWFLISRQEEYKGEGVWINNVWGKETSIMG